MITSQAPPVYGGAGAQALALSASLVANGLTVELLTQNQAAARSRETSAGVMILRCPGDRLFLRLPARAARIARSGWFLSWLTWRLLVRRYDVFHVHGSYWFSLPPTVLGRLRRIPVVVKVTRLGDDDAVTVKRKRLLGLPIGFVYAAPTRLATTVIALNEEIERRHRECFPQVAVRRLPNGVDIGRFRATPDLMVRARRELDVSNDAVVVAFVGYLTELKGVDDLVEAWLQAVDARSSAEPPATLLLAGPTGGGYRYLSDEVVAIASSPRARARGVRVLNHVAPEAMPLVYAAADVFAFPSRSEGMPNSLLEALAAGLPVIASAIPGVVDVVKDVPGSIVLADGTVDPLREALAGVLARHWPRQHERPSLLPLRYSIERLAFEYQAIYERAGADLRHEPRAIHDRLGNA